MINTSQQKIPYQILGLGDEIEKGGASFTVIGNISTVLKMNDEKRNFTMANEIVAAGFAQYLGLPIPPSGMIRLKNNEPRFFSLELFPNKKKPLTKPQPKTIANRFTHLSWGISLFDVFIMNKDRKPKNITYYEEFESPYIFDHGHSLFEVVGNKAMKNKKEWLAVKDHCLIKHLKRANPYKEWIQEIKKMPNTFIRRTVKKGLGYGYSERDCKQLTAFLIERKSCIHKLVKNQLGKFVSLPKAEKQHIRDLAL